MLSERIREFKRVVSVVDLGATAFSPDANLKERADDRNAGGDAVGALRSRAFAFYVPCSLSVSLKCSWYVEYVVYSIVVMIGSCFVLL